MIGLSHYFCLGFTVTTLLKTQLNWIIHIFVTYLTEFCSYVLRKNIEINVIDDEEYEKNEIFYVVLGEPKVVKDEDDDSGAGTDISYDAEKERLEELGKPRLGSVTHLYKVLYNIKTQLGHKTSEFVQKSMGTETAIYRVIISSCSL